MARVPVAEQPEANIQAAPAPPPPGRRMARNTVIFSIATGLSRVFGLAREIIASSLFGTSGAFSAFTIAFQVPNLLRSLVADAALSAAFVPVFTELLEQNRRRDAFRLASTLFLMILLGLGALVVVFIVLAGVIMPLFTGDTFSHDLVSLTVGLSRVLFPIVVLLGLNGLLVGILNAYDHFSIPALSPLLWNATIIGLLLGLHGLFHGGNQLYAYAIGILVGTALQLAVALPVLKRLDFRLELAFDWRSERVRQVLRLMLPVTIGLGVINFDLVLNSTLGTLVSDQVPRAIDAAFRIYMLPQGMFSVALATVLFPTLSRLAARRDLAGLRASMSAGVRQICLLLIPAAALTLILATPITRLVYERGSFGAQSTDLVSTALFWFSFGLPFAGVNLMLTRTFFSLQRPWTPTALAAANLAINAGLSVALYRPLGIEGLVIATGVANAGMTAGQAWTLRRRLGRLEGRAIALAAARILAAAVLEGAVAYGTWWGLDDLLGRALGAEVVSVGLAVVSGLLVYAGAVLIMGVREAEQVGGVLARRLRRA